MISKFDNLLFMDIETSGPSFFESVPLSVSIIPFNSKVESFDGFIRYENISWSGRGKEFFSDYQKDWEEKAIPPKTFCENLNSYLRGTKIENGILVGHNIGFDTHFLNRVYNDAATPYPENLSHRTIDTHTLLYILASFDKIPMEATSSDNAFELFKLSDSKKERHTAKYDALLTKELFKRILMVFEDRL